jgi:selenide,water dikinase
LRAILDHLTPAVDPNLLVGFSGADDAAVYRLDGERALVLTVDYFTPILDDPFDFGRVAAANSFSDVYAMGAAPLVALNIAAFPEGELGPEVLARILEGGSAVAREAGVVVAGGHTVADREVKYGMSVVGMIHPDRIVTNGGARPGDALVLTKALGTGVLATRLKAGKLADEHYAPFVASMTRLNKAASEIMRRYDVHACTDITGFGLLGHALEMAEASGVTLDIAASDLPVLPGALDAIEGHFVPGGAGTNRIFVFEKMKWIRPKDDVLDTLIVDPQTSGGLLVAVPAARAEGFVEALRPSSPEAAIVGRVAPPGEARLRIV